MLSISSVGRNLGSCDDNSMLEVKVNTEISQDFGDGHQNHGSDLCSPFCNCQCCHINTISTKFVIKKLKTLSITTQCFFYLIGEEENFTTSILEPPMA
mgnify:CR=1 FL=1